MWARYLEALKNRPIRTNAATAFVINFAGDILAQNIEGGTNSSSMRRDWERTWTVASFGMITAAPGYYWFRWLDHQFPLPQLIGSNKSGGSNKLSPRVLFTLAKKLSVHLGIFAPTINSCFYGWLILKDRLKKQQQQQQQQQETPPMSLQNLIQQSSMTVVQYSSSSSQPRLLSFWEEWYTKLERDLIETTKNSVKVWGTAQSFNFLLLPPHTRVLFSNSVMVIWTAYLSIVGHRKPVIVEEVPRD